MKNNKEERIINLILKRIKELKKVRNTLTTSGTKTKYNFVVGELQNILLDMKEIK